MAKSNNTDTAGLRKKSSITTAVVLACGFDGSCLTGVTNFNFFDRRKAVLNSYLKTTDILNGRLDERMNVV